MRMLIIFVLAWTAVRLLRGLTTPLHKRGLVEGLTLRAIRLRDLSGDDKFNRRMKKRVDEPGIAGA